MKYEKNDSFTEMDHLLKDVLKPVDEPDMQVNRSILAKVEEENSMGNHKMRAAVLATICIMAFGSISVAAAVHFLSPANVAEKQGDARLATALEKGNQVAEYESQIAGDYKITFMGLVSGDNVTDFPVLNNHDIVESETYAVTAIERENGTSIAENASQWELNFQCSFFVEGLNPYVYRFANSSRAFCEDGVIYCIMSSDNIEMFADRNVYLAVYEDAMSLEELYSFDETTGKINKKEYTGKLGVLFEVQLDSSKADPEAAKQYLKEQEEGQYQQEMSEGNSLDEGSKAFSYQLVTSEELQTEDGRNHLRERGELAATVPCQIRPTEEGDPYVEYSYEIDGICREGRLGIEKDWEDDPAGTWIFMGYGECREDNSDKGAEGYADFLYKEADGSLTVNVFRITDKK